MDRVKLFVIQVSKGGTWDSECLYKGDLRQALTYATDEFGITASRIKRVKTPAEAGELKAKLKVVGEGAAQTEWMN
jgi:hypothetical protein